MTLQGGRIVPHAHTGLLERGNGLSPDDPKFIEVAPTALSTKGLLEGEDDTGDIVPVPDGAKDPVGKPAGSAGQRLVLHPMGQQQGRLSSPVPNPELVPSAPFARPSPGYTSAP